jgi:hypothetical protein
MVLTAHLSFHHISDLLPHHGHLNVTFDLLLQPWQQRILQNTGIHLQDYIMSQPRIKQSAYHLPRKPKHSYLRIQLKTWGMTTIWRGKVRVTYFILNTTVLCVILVSPLLKLLTSYSQLFTENVLPYVQYIIIPPSQTQTASNAHTYTWSLACMDIQGCHAQKHT